MNDPEWPKVKALLDRVLNLDPDEREAILDDPDLAPEVVAEVRALLDVPDDELDRFEEPIASFAQRASLLSPGNELGPYRIERELGSGGMGTVFLATRNDGEFAREVAIKVLRPSLASDVVVRRFRNERQILADLDHPHIAAFYEGGTTPMGLPYLVMEYIEGLPLHRFCDVKQLELNEVLSLFIGICEAVHFAHSHLVVHRDIKPGNILVTAQGIPKLLDFGIALLQDREAGQTLTRTGQGMPLTPGYAAPEQYRRGGLTTACDIYSLGVVLYQILTGSMPDTGWSETSFETYHMPDRPSKTLDHNQQHEDLVKSWAPRDLVNELDYIVLKALREHAQDRYPSVQQLAEDLRRTLEGKPVAARTSTLLYRSRLLMRRHRKSVLTAALMLVLVVGSAVGLAIQNRQIRMARDRSEAIRTFMEGIFSAEHRDKDEAVIDAETLLDRASLSLMQRSDLDPTTKAAMLESVAKGYFGLGLQESGEMVLVQALRITVRADKGPDALARSIRRAAELAGTTPHSVQQWLDNLPDPRALDGSPGEAPSLEPIYDLIDLAIGQYADGDVDKAIRTLHRIAVDPATADKRTRVAYRGALRQLASIYKHRGDLDFHAETLERLLELDGLIHNMLTHQSFKDLFNTYRRMGRFATALKTIETWLPRVEPKERIVMKLQGVVFLLDQGDLAGAEDVLSDLAASDPMVRHPHIRREFLALKGELHQRRGEHTLAIEQFETLHKLGVPPNKTCYCLLFPTCFRGMFGMTKYQLLESYLASGDLASARRLYWEGSGSPDRSSREMIRGLYDYGRELAELQRWSSSQMLYHCALLAHELEDTDDDLSHAMYLGTWGLSLRRRHQFQVAIDPLSRSLAIFDGLSDRSAVVERARKDVRIGLAWAWTERGEFEDAHRLLEDIFDSGKLTTHQLVDSQYLFSLFDLERGRYDQAGFMLRNAIKYQQERRDAGKATGDNLWRMRRAYVGMLEKTGQFDRARTFLRRMGGFPGPPKAGPSSR
ncbi:Non-specific serine/threonine protein kinase [Sulfidibacter corallicola]|uniref:Serine/threonine protein kinase n=1 Tax=Sulfidibacter corallicola TaxID=2818388 RepID=A0A8A4TM78_SULCO|nr:serine/threonine-protein kinase [Sulfidibacter corallicola]QTD50670.1 serine/threonine protein kinase [Sulfidibacter corallicola]